jgi:uncharacterized protein YciI
MRTMCNLSLVLIALISSLIPCGGQQDNAGSGGAAARKTFIVIYKPGPGWVPGKSLREQPLQEHGKYILSLYSQGLLKLGGPFADETGGAAVFEAADDKDAKAIVAKDPAVVSQIFVPEVHPWALVQWEQQVKK